MAISGGLTHGKTSVAGGGFRRGPYPRLYTCPREADRAREGGGLFVAAEILIIWPDTEAALTLAEALDGSSLQIRTRVVDTYPGPGFLRSLIGESDTNVIAVVVGISNDVAADLLAEVVTVAPNVIPVAAARSLDASLIRAAMRAGAVEFLAPPFDLKQFEETIVRRTAADAPAESGQRIAVVPARATDGASMLAIHAAHVISRVAGASAVLVDCDLQCGSTCFRLGLKPAYTLADAIAHLDSLDDLWGKIATEWNEAHVLPAPDSSSVVAVDDEAKMIGVVESAARSYQHVVVDLPPALPDYCDAILLECAPICLVCTPDLTSLHLAQRKVKRLRELGVPKDTIRLVVNRADSRTSVRPGEIEKVAGLSIFAAIPNDFIAVSQAALEGGVVRADTPLGAAISGFACHVAGLEEKKPVGHERSSWARLLRLS